MRVQYLFNSNGEWIAFRVGKYIFNKEGKWIGWLPWNDGFVVNRNGQYLGHIFSGNRFYKKYNPSFRGYPGRVPYPSYPGYPGYPGRRSYSLLPPGTKDIQPEKLKIN